MKTRISWIFYCLVSFMLLPSLSAAERFVTNESNGFTWIQQGKAYPILVDSQEDKGVLRRWSIFRQNRQSAYGYRMGNE